MKRAGELLAFSGLAATAHLALWGALAGESGAGSAGDGGEDVVSLSGATGAVTEMVEAWTAPPEAMADMTEMAAMTAPDSAPTLSPTPDAQVAPSGPTAPLPGMADTAPERLPSPAAPPATTLQSVDQPQLPDPLQDLALALPETTAPARPATPVLPGAAPPPPADSPAPRVSKRPVERPADLAKAEAPKVQQTAPKPKKGSPKAGAQKQTAKGKSNGQNAGAKKVDQGAATLSKAQRRNLMAHWGASIRNNVDRKKRRPAGTNASGTAVVRLTVSPQGRLLGAKLATSSGDPKLDAAALKAVQRARVPRAPEGLGNQSYSFNLPIAFAK